MPRKRVRDERGRPEEAAAASGAGGGSFYDADETSRYSAAAARTGVQRELTQRALRTLHWLSGWAEGERRVLLELGCGAGASTEVAEEIGHRVIGLDSSMSMLRARPHTPCNDVLHWDLCAGLPLRSGARFDGGFSISALQWLLAPPAGESARAQALFAALHASLADGAHFVAQIFPRAPADAAALVCAARRAGFGGGRAFAMVDMPHANRSMRLYLCLCKAALGAEPPPAAPPLCPCAWPLGATCALALRAERTARAGAGGGVACAGGCAELGAGSDTCLERLRALHYGHARRAQGQLQQLWASSGLSSAAQAERRAWLSATAEDGPDPAEADAALAGATAALGGSACAAVGTGLQAPTGERARSMTTKRDDAAPPPAGATPTQLDASGAQLEVEQALYRRRALVEAWFAGEAKAHARQLGEAWAEAHGEGVGAVARAAEAEVHALSSLRCFGIDGAAADLYLARPPQRRGRGPPHRLGPSGEQHQS